jgi:hypothetical protein
MPVSRSTAAMDKWGWESDMVDLMKGLSLKWDGF